MQDSTDGIEDKFPPTNVVSLRYLCPLVELFIKSTTYINNLISE